MRAYEVFITGISNEKAAVAAYCRAQAADWLSRSALWENISEVFRALAMPRLQVDEARGE